MISVASNPKQENVVKIPYDFPLEPKSGLLLSLFVGYSFHMSNLGQITATLRTDTGLVRDHNEDFVSYHEPSDAAEEKANGWLYIVADGVGGADAGEVASELASERTAFHYLAHPEESNWGQRLVKAMQAANTDLRQYVLERGDNSRMATTMVTAVIKNNHAFIGNVGDSRGYHWRKGKLSQITKDQSLVAKLVEEGAITEEEAQFHPRRNVILYSIGSERAPKIELFEQSLEHGDILFLCSDGLTRHVYDEEIAQILGGKSPDEASKILIRKANERGGEDNISVGIVLFEGETAVSHTTALNSTSKNGSQPRVVMDGNPSANVLVFNRSLLLLYTLLLGLVQIILTFLVWFLLRV